MEIDLTGIFNEINEQTSMKDKLQVSQNVETEGMYLKEINVVRVVKGKREHLRTILIKIDDDPTEKIAEHALPYTKFGAVMIVKVYEKVEMELAHNPDYVVPVQKYKQAREWQRRGLGRR